MENYAADALFLSPRKLSTFAKQRTAPFYLYDEAGIRAVAKALLETFRAFSGFRQYFPAALNPNPTILRILQEAGFGVLCENEAQLRLAAGCGFTGERILYAPMVFYRRRKRWRQSWTARSCWTVRTRCRTAHRSGPF